jgi:integrase
MASVFVKDGRLVLQLRIRGVQLREALHLRDTAANRKWAEGECILIERELVTGTFDYWQHFPRSRSAKAKAIFPRRDRPEELTVKSWIRRWLPQVKPRWGSAMSYDVETMVNRHIVPEIGDRLLADLTIEDVGKLTGVLRQRSGTHGQRMGPERIIKILKVLKRALQTAIDAGMLLRLPMAGWRPLRAPKPQMRPFAREEFWRLLDALPIEWRPYFEFAVWTGLRPGEQAALQWPDVDLNGTLPVVEVRATLDPRKSGVRRPPKTRESAGAVQLIPQAVAVLKGLFIRNDLAGSWVFPAPDGGPLNISNLTRRVYYPALRRAKVLERSLYNLRHTFAVFMLEAGENPGWVARQMRHASAEMLWRRYARWWPRVAQSDGSRAEHWWQEQMISSGVSRLVMAAPMVPEREVGAICHEDPIERIS